MHHTSPPPIAMPTSGRLPIDPPGSFVGPLPGPALLIVRARLSASIRYV